mmetsp:Transcript_15184/g.38009  ORF Transcript_15184/g.38009 Transcript_15184/m.38009 type:complete len:99 (+) Transcript_15184:140-436(+)
MMSLQMVTVRKVQEDTTTADANSTRLERAPRCSCSATHSSKNFVKNSFSCDSINRHMELFKRLLQSAAQLRSTWKETVNKIRSSHSKHSDLNCVHEQI